MSAVVFLQTKRRVSLSGEGRYCTSHSSQLSHLFVYIQDQLAPLLASSSLVPFQLHTSIYHRWAYTSRTWTTSVCSLLEQAKRSIDTSPELTFNYSLTAGIHSFSHQCPPGFLSPLCVRQPPQFVLDDLWP